MRVELAQLLFRWPFGGTGARSTSYSGPTITSKVVLSALERDSGLTKLTNTISQGWSWLERHVFLTNLVVANVMDSISKQPRPVI